MSLAARCPACGTAFRVVPDQLRVSEGWVRCGRCAEVFNANETLFDLRSLEAPAPRPAASPASSIERAAAAAWATGSGAPSQTDLAAPAPIAAAATVPPEPAAPSTAEPAREEGEAVPFEADVAAPMPEPASAPPEPWAQDGWPGTPAEPATWDSRVEPTLGPEPEPEVDADRAVTPGTVDEAWPAPGVAPDVEPVEAPPFTPAPPADGDRGGAAALESDDAAPPDHPAEPGGEPAPAAPADAAPAVELASDTGAAAPPHGAEPVVVAAAGPSPDEVPAQSAEANVVQPSGLEASEAAAAPAPAPEEPAFLREADKAARWRSPEVRAMLGGAAVLLAGAALVQGTRGFHEPIAAQFPGARAWLDPLCRIAGCQTQPRRRLEGLSVEGSSLVKIDGSALMRLSLVLRNRDPGDLLLPAVELTLTDVQGAVVARKVLTAADLGAGAASIAAGTELTLQAVLDTGERAVTGYTVELFYP